MSKDEIILKIDFDLQDIVPGFFEKRKAEVTTLWDAYRKEDYSSLENIGHRLKGNAGGYGFDHLGLLGAQLEENAKSKSRVKVEPILREIEDYLARVKIEYDSVA